MRFSQMPRSSELRCGLSRLGTRSPSVSGRAAGRPATTAIFCSLSPRSPRPRPSRACPSTRCRRRKTLSARSA